MIHRIVALIALLSACFSPVPGANEVPPLDSLTTEWGCGHGFWVSNPEQTAALHISYIGDGRPGPEVTLPDPDWRASLIVGTDLHANWCDDVIERGEPVPVEHGRLEVVAGQLRLLGAVPDDFSGQPLSVSADDLVATTEDGTRVELGSIEITNEFWGTFAG